MWNYGIIIVQKGGSIMTVLWDYEPDELNLCPTVVNM